MAFEDLLPRMPSDTSGSSTPTPPLRTSSSRATPSHLRHRHANNQPQNRVKPSQTSGLRPQPNRPMAPRRQQSAAAPGKTLSIARQSQTQMTRSKPPPNPLELCLFLYKVPRSWGTCDIYHRFTGYGNVVRVDIVQRRTQDLHAVVVFRPAPKNVSWVDKPFPVDDPEGFHKLMEVNMSTKSPYYHYISDVAGKFPDSITAPLAEIDFGVMKEESKMLILQTVESTMATNAEVTMNMQFKELTLRFPVQFSSQSGSGTTRLVERVFKLQITPAQIRESFITKEEDGSQALVFSIDTPPMAFRRATNIKDTHNNHVTLWDDRQTWFRQTDIDVNPRLRDSAIELRKRNCMIDIGRWLTYRLKFSPKTVASPDYRELCRALGGHNIKMVTEKDIVFTYNNEPESLWDWLEPPKRDHRSSPDSFLSEMQELAHDSIHLPFSLRYQLEVCLSVGALQECNLDRDFVKRLMDMDLARAVKVLEKVADRKERHYSPSNIFALQSKVSVVQKKRPGYCIKIPSVNITPTTIYLATPVLETSNRVIRQFQQHEDRFLRVKFTDERYKGRLMSADDQRMNELYSRVKRAMMHGVQIGDRNYEFLAFGNSQFREHGAYFFASTTGLTASMIRDWMGNFTHISIIAKYVSRLGQCFSTTRAIPHAVTLEKIPDIERNGFCFTDGAGKMSPFLARMIAHHFGLPNSEQNYPTAVQFRLAGCKGVLAVDPALKGLTVQIRPSQEKFAAKFYGLEICRISQFSTANLNMQLILVLSALGIRDEVFIGKLRTMLKDLQEAMISEKKALELLQKNIDFNRMTISLASMIIDGFMETKDPFFTTCLRLWRSWNLKYLKEKARIYIEQGFFGLGLPDETGTLKGHYTNRQAAEGEIVDDLPEIFLQVPDPEVLGEYRVIEGICMLTRNPCMHPGDVRVVCAVDVPALHHHRDVVIIPTTGDRDLANMCSGGDLDGDDYLVMWDLDLRPREVNHPAMDYTSSNPVQSQGEVSVDDMTSFFVQHIKNDNLGRIAVAHRYWADQLDLGVKDPKCLELAQLHSKAVDYAKTGVPAVMSPELRVQKWPHWCEPKGKSRGKVYTSHRVLGKLYDEVKNEPFHGAWELPFDERILNACQPKELMMQDAKEIKAQYDEAIRRIMTQQGIKTEFEVWTTFVLDHHQEIGDYKFAETIGEIANTVKQQYQELCYEKAGVDLKAKDMEKMKPFLVAMYRVTANEVSEAVRGTKTMLQRGGRDVPLRLMDFNTMPFMSFPWLFPRELGQIATKGNPTVALSAMPKPTLPKASQASKQSSLLEEGFKLPELPEVGVSDRVVRPGQLLDVFPEEATGGDGAQAAHSVLLVPNAGTSSARTEVSAIAEPLDFGEPRLPSSAENKTPFAALDTRLNQEVMSGAGRNSGQVNMTGKGEKGEDEVEFDGGGGEEFFEDVKASRLDNLQSLSSMADIESENETE